MDLESIPKHNLEYEYLNHPIFGQLSELSDFYDSLSNTTIGFINHGTRALLNFDTYVFTSISGTLESIRNVLINGRLNDAYSLLRKYFDASIINIYTNLYLNDNLSTENFVIDKIDNWCRGQQALPEFRVMSRYVKESNALKPITNLLSRDKTYKKIRERCNDHTHYNFFQNMLLNDNQVYYQPRVEALRTFQSDLIALFVQHFGYLFYLKDHYMISSDYSDYLDVDLVPEEGSQYWVASFIQDAFDKFVKVYRADIAEELKSNTMMQLH